MAGHWEELVLTRHINELEILAVMKAISHWRHLLQGQSVAILSDNTTVGAYIKRQGGTKSLALCQLTLECLKDGVKLRERTLYL